MHVCPRTREHKLDRCPTHRPLSPLPCRRNPFSSSLCGLHAGVTGRAGRYTSESLDFVPFFTYNQPLLRNSPPTKSLRLISRGHCRSGSTAAYEDENRSHHHTQPKKL